MREPFRGRVTRDSIDIDGLSYVHVFSEDECLTHDPDRTTVHSALRGFFGQRLAPMVPLFDGGDFHVDGEPGLAMVCHDCDGTSSLFVAADCLPYAALFGFECRHAFESLAAVRHALNSAASFQRLPRLVHETITRSFVGIDEVAGIFQNEGPLDSKGYAEAIAWVDKALADPLLKALRADAELVHARRILVASVVPRRDQGSAARPRVQPGVSQSCDPDDSIIL